ncbi:MAG: DNA recombination protein RmuC [Propionibacteriaceae bacterium]
MDSRSVLVWCAIAVCAFGAGFFVARVRATLRAESLREQAASWQIKHAEVAAQVSLLTSQRNDAEARYDELVRSREELADQFQLLAAREAERHQVAAEQSAEARLQQTELLLRPLREQLTTLTTQYQQIEKDRSVSAADLRAHVLEVRHTSEQLRRETSALATALRKPHVRGAWGEAQLKRVVEAAGMLEHCDFETQSSASRDGALLRPDLTVRLTEGRVVYVDAKVPLNAFLEWQAADDTEQEQVRADFGRHVRTHLDQLGSKRYWELGSLAAPEFVVMFLPGDGLLLHALEAVPDLYDVAARKGVVVASPSTLIAMLRTVEHTWRQIEFLHGAEEVRKTGVELYDRLRSFASRFAVVGARLDQATRAYNESVGTFQARVMPKARRFEELKVATGEPLADVADAEGAAREVALPELQELLWSDNAGAEQLVELESEVKPIPNEVQAS